MTDDQVQDSNIRLLNILSSVAKSHGVEFSSEQAEAAVYAMGIISAEAAREAVGPYLTAIDTLEWYGEQARLARLIHSEGDAGRHALADDGGKRARAVLQTCPDPVS